MKPINEISLDDLVNNIQTHNKLVAAEIRIKQLEDAGNKLAFLMLNGTTKEMREAYLYWRVLVELKIDEPTNGTDQ
jgi:hypothetical protein